MYLLAFAFSRFAWFSFGRWLLRRICRFLTRGAAILILILVLIVEVIPTVAMIVSNWRWASWWSCWQFLSISVIKVPVVGILRSSIVPILIVNLSVIGSVFIRMWELETGRRSKIFIFIFLATCVCKWRIRSCLGAFRTFCSTVFILNQNSN